MPNNPKQLERLELAIQAIKIDRITFVRKATQFYDVSRSTLQRQINNIKEHVQAYCTKRKLTKTKEDIYL